MTNSPTESTKQNRTRSTGAISERKTATGLVRFEARVSMTGADGKRKQIGKTFAKEVDAKRWLRTQLAAVDAGTISEDHRITVDQYLTRWLDSRASQLRPSSERSYRTLLTQHVIPRVGKVKLVDLKPSQLEVAYLDVMEASKAPGRRPVGPATVQRANAVLKAALHDAQRDGLVVKNVASLARMPKASKPARNWWEVEQVRAFQEFTKGDRHQALWLLLLRCGFRRGEALGLRWSDLDLETVPARAHVTQQVLAVGSEVLRGEPKSEYGVRDWVLDGTTVAALKAWRKVQAAERLAAGTAWGGDPEIFTNTVGRVTDPAAISKRFRALAKEAGLPVIRLHDARHTALSQLIAAGVPIAEVSKLAGHSSIVITVDTYGHMMADRKEAASLAMAKRLDG